MSLTERIEQILHSMFLDNDFYDSCDELRVEMRKVPGHLRWTQIAQMYAAVAAMSTAALGMGQAFYNAAMAFEIQSREIEAFLPQLSDDTIDRFGPRFMLLDSLPDWLDYNMPNWMWEAWCWLAERWPERFLPHDKWSAQERRSKQE